MRSVGALSSQSWMPGMPGPPGSHFLPLPSQHWQGWGRGQSTPARQKSSLNFVLSASICHSFFWTLALAQVTRHPTHTPHTQNCIRLSPSHYPFGFAAGCGRTCREVESLAHASPPPPCHLKRHQRLAACFLGEHRFPQVVVWHLHLCVLC